MSDPVITPNFGLTLPVVGTTSGGLGGTAWGTDLTSSLKTLDANAQKIGNVVTINNASGPPPAPVGAISVFAVTGAGYWENPLGQVFPLAGQTPSGTIYASLYSSFATVTPSTNPVARVLRATGTIAIIDGGPGGFLTLSGSGGVGQITQVLGTGGTSVSTSATVSTVSSSVYADKFASYAVVSGSANKPPNARLLTGSNGITVVDTGTNIVIGIQSGLGELTASFFNTTPLGVTWVVPAGIKLINVQGVGGGGGGGGGAGAAASGALGGGLGGGAGGAAQWGTLLDIPVTPGEILTVVIDPGGTAGNGGSGGGAGGAGTQGNPGGPSYVYRVATFPSVAQFTGASAGQGGLVFASEDNLGAACGGSATTAGNGNQVFKDNSYYAAGYANTGETFGSPTAGDGGNGGCPNVSPFGPNFTAFNGYGWYGQDPEVQGWGANAGFAGQGGAYSTGGKSCGGGGGGGSAYGIGGMGGPGISGSNDGRGVPGTGYGAGGGGGGGGSWAFPDAGPQPGAQGGNGSQGAIIISWSVAGSGGGSGGGGGADVSASYVTLTADGLLPNSRILTASGGTSVTDDGALSNVIISSSIGADLFAPYVLVSGSAVNTKARILTGSGGVSIIDGGPGGFLTISGSGGNTSVVGQAAVHVTSAGSTYTVSASVVTVAGQGGSSVANGGGTTYTVSSSIGASLYSPNIVVSGSTDPQARTIQGIGGISLIDNGAGSTLQISSSAPVATVVLGTGANTVTHSGTTFTVSASVVTVAGAGGTSVSNGGGTTYVASSSLVTVAGAGGVSVSNGGGTTYTASSSLVTVAGLGGTSVANGGGTTYTVSSSVGADLFASYAIVSGSAVDTKARILQGIGGISLIDNGAGSTLQISASAGATAVVQGTGAVTVATTPGPTYTVSASVVTVAGTGATTVTNGGGTTYTASSSLGADRFASYLVVSGATGFANDPQARLLAPGAGITLVDNGPGSTLLIIASSSGGGSTTVVGAGGTTVTGAGSPYTVSSSVGADIFASYVLVGANANDTKARVLTAGPNITINDGGPGGNITITGSAGGGSSGPPFLSGALGWHGANYTLKNSDDIVFVNTSVANLTMSLPSAASTYQAGVAKVFYIKDAAGSGSINSFNVAPAGTDTFELTTGSYTARAAFEVVRIASDGGGWFRL